MMAPEDAREPRRDAARFAVANTEIEGGTLSPEALGLLDDWVSGRLDDDRLIEQSLRRWGSGANRP